jgi:class 3 adenylate cyclase
MHREAYYPAMVSAPSSDLACVECGALLPAASKFCLECGTPVPTATERETRRTVTLLFTDVTGSTDMGEHLDPEAYRGVMSRYFAVARTAIERHGGTVEKFVGDAVLAVFGVPEVREDDALRAVRAASELNDAVAELSNRLVAELGVRLAIRTGVNTGAVVTGTARAGGSFATGDAVNTAARLEQAANPGEILLGVTTYALVRDAVRATPADFVLAKGKAEPVAAYRLLGVLDAIRGRRRREDVALVGRAQESRTLDDALDRTITTGRSHLITVVGQAGIGKSRLVSEFMAGIGERADVAYGRCASYGQGITYWPLVQVLRDAVGLAGSESDEITRHALEQALGPAQDRDEVVDVLMALLGKVGVTGGTERTFWSVRRLLEALASRRPLVLLLDDLHWAEATLLELLERVREEVSDLPLLLLCQARPELLEQHPGWGSGALNSMTLGLDPLTAAETTASVAALLGGEPPVGLGELVAAWSGGNPLFVEEIVAHLVESGALVSDLGGWRIVGELDQAQLPPTVSALLASRIDRLPRAERDLLERVSVIGLEFTAADSKLLTEPVSVPELTDLLASLARRDLVRRVRSPQGDSWAFKHAIVRDAAYDGLAKSLRADLHEHFADGLAFGAEAGAEQSGLVAHHLEQAARYHRELGVRGPQVEVLVERASEELVSAADDARDQEQDDACVAYLKRAGALKPTKGAMRRKILARLAFSHYDRRQFHPLADVLSALEAELDETAGDLDRSFLRTLRNAREMFTTADIDPDQVSGAAREMVELGREAGDIRAVVTGLRVLSDTSLMSSMSAEAWESCEEIIRIGSAADVREAWMTRGAVLIYGDATLREARDAVRHQATIVGNTEVQGLRSLIADALVAAADCSPDARDVLAAMAARMEELRAAGKLSHPFSFLIDAFELTRDLDGAIVQAQRVSDTFRRLGDTGHASTYILEQAVLMLERGDPPENVVPLVEEGATYTSPYDAYSVSLEATCRAILALRAGDHDVATDLVTEALGVIDKTDQVWGQADVRRWLSAVPRATGDIERERRMLREANRMYRRKEILSYDPEIRTRLAELG